MLVQHANFFGLLLEEVGIDRLTIGTTEHAVASVTLRITSLVAAILAVERHDNLPAVRLLRRADLSARATSTILPMTHVTRAGNVSTGLLVEFKERRSGALGVVNIPPSLPIRAGVWLLRLQPEPKALASLSGQVLILGI